MRRPGRALAALGLWPALLLALLLALAWELFVDLGGVDDFLLPAPSQIAASLYRDRGLLLSNFAVTAREVVLGIAVALIAGLACAVALHFSSVLRRAAYPLLVASQAIPVPVIAPLLVAWLGFALGPKLLIVALVCFFPVVVTTLDGLQGVDPELRRLLRTLDASRLRIFGHVEAPAALPSVLSGTKVAVAVSVIGAVLGELSGSSAGLGHLVQQAIPQLETARAYAAVAVLAVFAIALFGLLSLAERRVLAWSPRIAGGIG